MPASHASTSFTSTRGGVMTVEVGSISGELEVCTRLVEGEIEVTVRYAGADEWYAVEGSPVEDREGCHERIVERLTTPGEKRGFNEDPVSVSDLYR